MGAVQSTDCIDPCCTSESGREGVGPDLSPCTGARELGERIVSLSRLSRRGTTEAMFYPESGEMLAHVPIAEQQVVSSSSVKTRVFDIRFRFIPRYSGNELKGLQTC